MQFCCHFITILLAIKLSTGSNKAITADFGAYRHNTDSRCEYGGHWLVDPQNFLHTLLLRCGSNSRVGAFAEKSLGPDDIQFLYSLPPRELQALCEACGELPAAVDSRGGHANPAVPDMVEGLRRVRGPPLDFLHDALAELRARSAPPPPRSPEDAAAAGVPALPKGFLVSTRRSTRLAAAAATTAAGGKAAVPSPPPPGLAWMPLRSSTDSSIH